MDIKDFIKSKIDLYQHDYVSYSHVIIGELLEILKFIEENEINN